MLFTFAIFHYIFIPVTSILVVEFIIDNMIEKIDKGTLFSASSCISASLRLGKATVIMTQDEGFRTGLLLFLVDRDDPVGALGSLCSVQRTIGTKAYNQYAVL